MQREILTPPKVAPATLDQGCAWLEEMQHRLKQNVHPRTIVAFVNDTLSGITQYYRTVGNIWDSLYGKHQLRESTITLERVYAMLAEFLIELKLHEEQDKIAQLVTGSSSTVKHSMYDEYINASKGKVPMEGKGKESDGKGGKSRWRPPCDDYWKPGGCSQEHNCPKYHPRKQPGRCSICGSTRHPTSQCNRTVKPKAKNVEWEESTWSYDDEEWYDHQWESEEYEASKGKKGRGKGSKPKEKSKDKSAPRLITPRPSQSSPSQGDRPRPKPKPEARSCMTSDFFFAMLSTKSKPTWRHSTWNGTDYMICTMAEPQKKLPVFRAGKWSLVADRRVYGHDAKTTKNFTLDFDTKEQCETLDRAWFGEMWFPVQRHTYHVQSSVTHDCISDPATHVLLPGHMLPKGARSFEVTVNLAVGKEKAKCWRNEVYAEDRLRAYPLLPLGRLANLLDTKFVWEDGTAVMQCRDKGKWRTMTKFQIRNNMAYASQMQLKELRRALWVQQAQPQTVFTWKFWERAAQDPKMTSYRTYGVKGRMCETTPFLNTVERTMLRPGLSLSRQQGSSKVSTIGLYKGDMCTSTTLTESPSCAMVEVLLVPKTAIWRTMVTHTPVQS